MRTVISRVMLIGGAFLLSAPVLADFSLNPVDTGQTFLVVYGDPQARTGSWEQRLGASSDVVFDLFAVRMASAGDFFESPTYENFSQSTWGLEVDGSLMASASGDSVGSLEWDAQFAGDASNPLMFDCVAFSGSEIVSAARAVWSGETWSIMMFSEGEGALWLPDREDVVVPIPAQGAALLAVVGLGVVGWVRRRIS